MPCLIFVVYLLSVNGLSWCVISVTLLSTVKNIIFFRICLHRLSTVFIMNILLPSQDFAYVVTEDITTRMLSMSYLNQLNSAQLQLIVQLLADMVIKSEQEQQIRSVYYILGLSVILVSGL